MSQPIKILLIEGHADSAKVMAMMLCIESQAVKIAVGAAPQAAASESFDVLLCDQGLPDGSGLDLTRDVKSC